MGVIDVAKGDILHRIGDRVGTLDIILKGNVKISAPVGSITLSNGGILGITEAPGDSYSHEYVALEDTSLYVSPYKTPQDISKVILSNPKISNILASTAVKTVCDVYDFYQTLLTEADTFFHFIKKNYEDYTNLCGRFSVPLQSFVNIEELEAFSSEDEVPSWLADYYHALKAVPSALRKEFYSSDPMVCVGTILQAVQAIELLSSSSEQIADYMYETTSFLINEVGGDFFDLYSNLVFKSSQNPFNDTTPIEAAVSKLIISLEGNKYLDKELLVRRIEQYRQALREMEDLLLQDPEESNAVNASTCEDITGSLQTILDYSGYDKSKCKEFIELVTKYKNLTDRNSTEDDARSLRRHISDHFYDIYEAAFLKSTEDTNVPTVLKMFFYFGYMDEEIAGNANATQLYDLANNMKPDEKGIAIPMYDWLLKVYYGDEEPSKNEFDLDYAASLRERRASGSITVEQEKSLLSNKKSKLHFEIQNMFKLTNRITFGRVTTFCPILSEHNILRPLKNIYLTSSTLHTVFNKIRSIDFSCFYRETVYSDTSIGITREYVQKEVMPHVLLLPNIGTRGSLWQEITGSRRDTPARMMVSIFPTEDISDILMRLCGEFRWELCKRIQGVHWNDVTDRSLTSEYFDYIQFYRKNHELSPETKDKIKIALQKAKNSFREVFVMDYIAWVKYEGNGSPRLNKYARNIIFTYCPFPKKLREELHSNPMYTDLFDRYKLRLGQKKHMMDVLYQKLSNAGTPVPAEIEDQKRFLDM